MFVLFINNQLIYLGAQWIKRLLIKRGDWVPTPYEDDILF